MKKRGVASVPEKQTRIFFYTITRQVARARNRAGFGGDAGMSAGARGAVNSIATTEVGGEEGRTGAAGVSRSTGQRSGLWESSELVAYDFINDLGRMRRNVDRGTECILGNIP